MAQFSDGECYLVDAGDAAKTWSKNWREAAERCRFGSELAAEEGIALLFSMAERNRLAVQPTNVTELV